MACSRPLGTQVTIDPKIEFGIPQVHGVRTETIAEAFATGEDIDTIAKIWNLPSDDVNAAIHRGDDDEPEWLASEFPEDCYMEVGRFDTGTPIGWPDLLTSNRHLRDVLTARGSKVHYSEFSGGHDFVCSRGTIGEGVIALTEGWEARHH